MKHVDSVKRPFFFWINDKLFKDCTSALGDEDDGCLLGTLSAVDTGTEGTDARTDSRTLHTANTTIIRIYR